MKINILSKIKKQLFKIPIIELRLEECFREIYKGICILALIAKKKQHRLSNGV